MNPGNYGANVAADLKPEDIQPWAADLVKQRAANLGRDHPSAVGCLPHGPSVNTISFLMQKFIQTPNVELPDGINPVLPLAASTTAEPG